MCYLKEFKFFLTFSIKKASPSRDNLLPQMYNYTTQRRFPRWYLSSQHPSSVVSKLFSVVFREAAKKKFLS